MTHSLVSQRVSVNTAWGQTRALIGSSRLMLRATPIPSSTGHRGIPQAGFMLLSNASGPNMGSVELDSSSSLLMLKKLCCKLTSHHHHRFHQLLFPALENVAVRNTVLNLTVCENGGWVSIQS